MSDAQKFAESLGSMIREWFTGQDPLSGNGLERVLTLRLKRFLDAREAKAEPDPRDTYYKLMTRAQEDAGELLLRAEAAEARVAELERENAWLIECNGRASVRAERAEDNEEVSLRLRDQAQADAAKFLERANDLEGKYDALLTTWTESRERHLEAEAALASRKVHELGSNPVTALADVAAILSPEGEAKREATSTEALGRFGHHPDPAIDFEVEVGDIEGSAYEAIAGHLDRTALLDRAERALSFRVGAVESCINAKATLRKIVADLKAPTLAQPARDTDPVPATVLLIRESYRPAREGETPAFIDLEFGPMVRRKARSIARRAAGITGKGTSDE